jgi:hypothetical protein
MGRACRATQAEEEMSLDMRSLQAAARLLFRYQEEDVRIENFKWLWAAVFALYWVTGLCPYAFAEANNWESIVSMMKEGADRMSQGGNLLLQRKEPASAEKMIKDGHRTMMEAEKAAAQLRKDTMRLGGKLVMDGVLELKAKNDLAAAEKLVAQGEKTVTQALEMMDDGRIERMMHGSRTMMRGVRMMQDKDVNAAEKLIGDGRNLMMEAAGGSK